MHFCGTAVFEALVDAAYVVVAAVLAARSVLTVALTLTVATPAAVVAADPAETGAVAAPVASLVNATGEPLDRLAGGDVGDGRCDRERGAGAHRGRGAGLAGDRRRSATGRAPPGAKVSGLLTLLVAPVESVIVAVTVVEPVADAEQVTSDCSWSAGPKTQSVRAAFQATLVIVRPVGRLGVTSTCVGAPGPRGC